MSRIGKLPISLPPQVSLKQEDRRVIVTGPKGSLEVSLPPKIKLDQQEGKIKLISTADSPKNKALYGLARSLLNNIVIGVDKGFEKKLELVGTGYRVKVEGQDLVLSLGFSHPVVVKPTPGVELNIESNNVIFIRGIDKQLVGQVAANIRALRPPEPYKGKGIRYSDEIVRRKAGKAAKAAA